MFLKVPIDMFFQSLIGAWVLSELEGMTDIKVVVDDLKINIAIQIRFYPSKLEKKRNQKIPHQTKVIIGSPMILTPP